MERAAASTERRNAALEAAEERGAARAERQETRETNRASRQAARTERLDERRAALTEAQAERERVREERIAEIAARREERIAALKEAAQTRVMNRGNAAITALERVASRLREHAGLVENRLDELSSAGIDVTTADQTLDSAVRTLSEAGDAIDMLRLDIEYVITSDTPREDWAAAKSQFRSVRDVLAETRSALRETVGELREAIREAEAGADTAQNENGA